MSLRGDLKSPAMTRRAASKASGPTPTKRRNSTLWSETLDVHQKSTFSTKEIKRQEVVQFSAFKCRGKPRRRVGSRRLTSRFSSRQFMNCSGGSRISLRISSLHERLEIFRFIQRKPTIILPGDVFLRLSHSGVPRLHAEALHHDGGGAGSYIWWPGRLHPPAQVWVAHKQS